MRRNSTASIVNAAKWNCACGTRRRRRCGGLRLQEGSLPAGVALFDRGWHAGIVGLVATRMKDRVHRPVVAFAPAGDGELRGSARSVAGVHVRDVLEAIDTRHPGLIERFGGHAMAAGLTLRENRLREFIDAFGDEVGRHLTRDQMLGMLETDGELAAGELSLETALALDAGGPWGQAFPEPLFDGVFDVVESRVLAQRHLKLWLRPAARHAARGSHRVRPFRRGWVATTAAGCARAAGLSPAIDELWRHEAGRDAGGIPANLRMTVC